MFLVEINIEITLMYKTEQVLMKYLSQVQLWYHQPYTHFLPKTVLIETTSNML